MTTQTIEEFVKSLTPREAKLLNTYVNLYNEFNEKYIESDLYDDDTYKHDEKEIDYKQKLLQKTKYFPSDYIQFMNRVRFTLNQNIETKYKNATRTLYLVAYMLDNGYDTSLMRDLIYFFEKDTDDFEYLDEFYHEL